jgi:cytoskeleton protein RodZ
VTNEPNDAMAVPPDSAAASAGVWLRVAREAAGLSQDAVAQQLKLAPRQVRALEEDDFAHLPGRTFVRGFVRNYARLVHLDPDAVVATLPSGEATSPLERLTYTPASRPMVEVPMETRRRGSAARWLIPLLLIAVVAVAVVYEYRRSQTTAKPSSPADGIFPTPAAAPASPPAGAANPASPSGPASTPLPNPLDSPKSEAPASAPAAVAAAKPDATPPVPTAATLAASDSIPTAAEPPLVLVFNGTSWVQVKDATGGLVLSQTVTAGTTLPVAAAPPLDVVIGNVDSVVVKYHGQQVDLAPHTRYNVARLLLK